MNMRPTAVPAKGPSGKATWALRMTNSKNSNCVDGTPMNAPSARASGQSQRLTGPDGR